MCLLQPGDRQGCPLLTTVFNILLESLADAIRQEKEIKVLLLWKKAYFFYSFNYYFFGKPERIDNKKYFLEHTSHCSKVPGYNVNMQKATALWYIRSEQLEFEVKSTIPSI